MISQKSSVNLHKAFSSFDAQSNTKPKPYSLAHLLAEYVTFKVVVYKFSGVESKQGTLSRGGQQLIIFQLTWTEVGWFLKSMAKIEKTEVGCELWMDQNDLSADSSVGVLN